MTRATKRLNSMGMWSERLMLIPKLPFVVAEQVRLLTTECTNAQSKSFRSQFLLQTSTQLGMD